MQPPSAIAAVQRVNANTALWILTAPCVSVDDGSGFEVAGNGSLSAVLSSDGLTVTATYSGGVVVGATWQLDGGSLSAPGGVVVTDQTGRVT